jgi:hypothetical protein
LVTSYVQVSTSFQYELEALALKTYISAAYDNDWITMLICWAVVEGLSHPPTQESKNMSYLIMGKYKGRTEEIDSCEDKQEAERLVGEYQLAFGSDWHIWVKES